MRARAKAAAEPTAKSSSCVAADTGWPPLLPLPLALGSGLGACSAGGSDTSSVPSVVASADAAAGSQVYETPLTDGNSFACATCHALTEPAAGGLRRPGHPIGEATRRAHWKNGKAASFLDAVNSCVTEWMVASAWSATEPRFVALRAFLDTQTSVEHAADLNFEIVAPPADLSGGDDARGQTLFNRTCIVCHGTDGIGTVRAPRIAGSARDATYVAKRIRTSGSTQSAVYAHLTGGVMPFWAKDRLADGEVRDLVAFVTRKVVPADGGDAVVSEAAMPVGASDSSVGSDADTARDSSPAAMEAAGDRATDATGDSPPPLEAGTTDAAAHGCGTTNPRVGWKADLGINMGEGQVSGLVTKAH